METRKLLEILTIAERLKDTTRHCYTKNGRRESVAEHSWMMTLMAFFMKDEFPEVDMDKVIKMCIRYMKKWQSGKLLKQKSIKLLMGWKH